MRCRSTQVIMVIRALHHGGLRLPRSRSWNPHLLPFSVIHDNPGRAVASFAYAGSVIGGFSYYILKPRNLMSNME
jgi:hypothetical protein